MPMLRHYFGSAGIGLAALVALGSGAAQAAPQILALVETKGKVGLTCSGSECSAELTSFCLDAGRFSPPRGTEYQVAVDGLIRLVGTTQDGRSLALDVKSHARFRSARRHLAVRVSVDRAALAALGVSHADIEVAANAALLPVAWPGDPNAITEHEAALFTGPLRQLGSLVVDGNTARMQAARVTSRMINLLPPNGGARAQSSETLWRRATAAGDKGSLSPQARKRARGAIELCRFVASINGSSSLRRCLQEQHDGFVDFLNSKFWKAVKTGT